MAMVPYRGIQVRRQNSALESLPSDVMSKVLEFADLPTRIHLAECSKTLQKLVYKQCKSLWVHIDFGEGTVRQKTRLNDAMLASLLVRVNARHVTQSLSLFRAPNIQGFGLAPLSMSRVLENVRLVDGATRIVLGSIVDILRTTIPFKLSKVHLGRNSVVALKYYPSVIQFLHDLSVARWKRAQEQRLVCSGCNEAVAENSLQLVPKRSGLPSTRCDTCRKDFCRRGSCSTGVLDCNGCGETSCESCSKVKRCAGQCSKSFCLSCRAITDCDQCLQGFCGSYRCQTIVSCPLCDKKLCDDCNEGRGDRHIKTCRRCRGQSCSDCRPKAFCDGCESFACTECAQVNQCDFCQMSLCVFCSEFGVTKCCNKNFCLDCGSEEVLTCQCCSRNICSDECGAYYCSSCDKDFCVECRPETFFSCCGESCCSECMIVDPEESLQCDGCNKTICSTHAVKCEGECGRIFCKTCKAVTKCDSCSKGYCSECRDVKTYECCKKTLCSECVTLLPSCDACDKSVCAEHDGKVCGKCEKSFDSVFYCGQCALVVRCSCGHSTCEQCRCSSRGFCSECNPKKKAKMVYV